MPNGRNKALGYLLSGISIALYIYIGYFLVREQNTALFASYTFLFACYIYFISQSEKLASLNHWIIFGIICRVVFLIAQPNLSDDFYRFIWDGRLSISGINPFDHIPHWYIENPQHIPGITEALFSKLNSPNYFTVYPPVNQLIFFSSSWIFPNSILGNAIALRCFILASEVGTICLIKKLLAKYALPDKYVLLYALNPLIILEFSSSLHFEAIMIFFVLASIYLLEERKWMGSAVMVALAICTKLIPLIFLPLLFKRLGFKKAMVYYFICSAVCIAMFAPLISKELVFGMSNSVSLYFQTFEFNASIYYLVREVGFYFTGYNIIGIAGKSLAFLTFLGIVGYTFLERRKTHPIPISYMWVYFIYILSATTVHPWYITPLIAFGLFSKFRFEILWAFTVFMSYLSYREIGFHENIYLLILEYGLVFAFLIYELGKYRQAHFSSNKS